MYIIPVCKSSCRQEDDRGFTLIELLVVIAIIGILASIILASLNQTRGKGADTAIKANLAHLRSVAEMQYSNLGCYAAAGPCSAVAPIAETGACNGAAVNSIFMNTNFVDTLAAITNASGGGLDSCASTVGGRLWAFAAVLKTDKTIAWCVDAQGLSKQMTNGATVYSQAALDADVLGARCGS